MILMRVVLPLPGAAEQRGDAGRGAAKAACSVKPAAALADLDSQHSAARGSAARGAPAIPAATGPASPSAKDKSARRSARASPSGDCMAVYSASGSVRVTPGMLEAKVITAPNSPRPAAKAVTRRPGFPAASAAA